MMNDKISRRRVLQGALVGLAAAPAATLISREAAASLPLVSETDAQAKSLAYVHDASKVDPKTNPAYKPGQKCINCLHYPGTTGPEGKCNIFPGKAVKAAGWCKVWMLKPGSKL